MEQTILKEVKRMGNNAINPEKQEQAKKVLEGYCKDWKIFIDTCSLLHFSSDDFWMNIIPLLHQYQNKIFIPLRSVEEIEKHSKNKDNAELAQKAKSCLKQLKQLVEAGYVEIRGEQTDNFADNVFQVVFTKFRMNHKLLLITQDNDLAKDILALNDNRSVKANEVKVNRINKYGFLSEFFWHDLEGKDSSSQPQTSKKPRKKDIELDEDETFRICSQVTSTADTKLKITEMPTEGSSVLTSKGLIRLVKELGAGGEATVYTTNTPYVAKIYKKDNITARKFEKIQLMLSKNIDCEGICYPVEIIYNSKKEFVGYLMPQAKGQELQKSVFGPKPLFLKKFPNWKKRDTVELCVTILEKIKYLHDRNIIMGDINPANILVVSPKEVYFVDTDSYQVEEYPCPVGTNNYTAPEIQRKHFSDFLRTRGNENFAVATLLFMIMLPGKPPYSQQGGEDPISNIIKMDFSYPFGDNSNKKTPDGPWRYIWSHLTYDLKEAFYNTFRKGGSYSQEKDRLSVDEWIPKFRYYLELLDSGKYAQQDEMSVELFPTRHKKNPKSTYIRCKLCGQEAEENRCKNGICSNCLDKGEVYKCKKCGKEILFTNYQKFVRGAKKHDICQDCFDYGRQVRIRQNCVDCGRIFELTNNQYDFYREKGFDIPKRCDSCRKNKSSRSTTYVPYSAPRKSSSSGSSSRSNGSSYSGSTGSYCFITTAVCEKLGKPDDCFELTTLRKYRDTWLINSDGGEELIKEYYRIAPLIVSKIKISDKYEELCQHLLETYINPCLDLIANSKNEECRDKYIEMVNYAKSLC